MILKMKKDVEKGEFLLIWKIIAYLFSALIPFEVNAHFLSLLRRRVRFYAK